MRKGRITKLQIICFQEPCQLSTSPSFMSGVITVSDPTRSITIWSMTIIIMRLASTRFPKVGRPVVIVWSSKLPSRSLRFESVLLSNISRGKERLMSIIIFFHQSFKISEYIRQFGEGNRCLANT